MSRPLLSATVALLLAACAASAAEIHKAATGGDRAAIQALAKQDATVLASKDGSGNQPLHLAAQARKVDAVELLIKLGADVNAAGFGGWTPLHCAAKSGSTDSVTALIKAGARADSQNDSGQTPLQVAAHDLIRQRLRSATTVVPGGEDFLAAASKGDLPSLDTLLAKTPALIKATDSVGNTALILAARAQRTAAARWLIEHGAELDRLSNTGRSALLTACHTENLELVEALLKAGAKADPDTTAQNTPLEHAIVLFDLKNKIQTPQGDLTKEAPLPLAIDRASEQARRAMQDETLEGRLTRSARGLTAVDTLLKQMEPLPPDRMAARLRMLELLLQHKADANRVSRANGGTPLSVAVANPDPSAVSLLLKHGADPNVGSSVTGTPLDVAITLDREAAFDRLLAAGARVIGSFAEEGEKPPLGLAAALGREKMLQKMLDHAKPTREQLAAEKELATAAASSRHPALVRRLIEAGMAVKAANSGPQWTPMHSAARQASPEVLTILLDAGASADLEHRDKAGYTPLQSAAEFGRADNIKLLLDRGARPDCRANDERTLLHSGLESGSLEAVKLLLTLKLDIKTKDNLGITPLMTAARLARPELVALLLEHKADVTPVLPKANVNALHLTMDLSPLTPRPGADPKNRLETETGTMEDRVRCLELLLKAGTDIEAGPGSGHWTPLSFAAKSGVLPFVEVLLRYGARTDNPAKDPQQRVALHYAAFEGHAEIIRALMKAGAKDAPCALQAGGASAVHFAAGNDRVEALQALLDGGAPINARDGAGATPLMWAAAQGREGTTKLLIGRKADLTPATKGGKTALDLATEGSHAGVARLLRNAGARN